MKELFKLIVIMTLLIAGCTPPITEGHVTGRKYIPAHTEQEWVDDSITIDDITIYSGHWETYTVPDKWYITFRKMNDETDDWQYRTVRVSERDYNYYKDGDFFKVD